MEADESVSRHTVLRSLRSKPRSELFQRESHVYTTLADSSDDQVIEALKSKKFKVMTITHGKLALSAYLSIQADMSVDTSTGVLSPVARLSKLVKTHSPDTLIVLDAVCSVASEEIRFDDWGIDVVISATQKGLGVPPGLSVVMASDRAIKITNARSTPVSSYYINWQRWQPIMQAYEAGQPKYFATRES